MVGPAAGDPVTEVVGLGAAVVGAADDAGGGAAGEAAVVAGTEVLAGGAVVVALELQPITSIVITMIIVRGSTSFVILFLP
jgi:hypothetical protein